MKILRRLLYCRLLVGLLPLGLPMSLFASKRVRGGFLIAGAIMAPIAFTHGTGVWFEFW